MIPSPIAVLGLDAADHELAKKWNCSNLLLDNHRKLETKAYSVELPATIEVWPSIATGVSPHQHGVWLKVKDQDYNFSLYHNLAIFNSYLPDPIKSRIIDIKRKTVGNTLQTTNHPHIFENGAVLNWPGITSSDELNSQTEEFGKVIDGTMSASEFFDSQLTYLCQALGWLFGNVYGGTQIAGVHVHILDFFGHLYSDDPDSLREVYEKVDDVVGYYRDFFDRFVIVSDHGIQNSGISEDERYGYHSWRAMVSTNIAGELPESILDFRSWIEPKIPSDERSEQLTPRVNAPIEHLEDLGYL